MKPFFSIIGTSIRNSVYMDFYNSISNGSKTDFFEIIFAGPNEPIEKMPKNFHYIKTGVKPGQCLEIAARYATGEYLIPSPDDFRFEPDFFNRLYRYTMRLDRDRYLISFRHRYSGCKPRDERLIFSNKIPNSPVAGSSGCYRRDLWSEMGGIDKGFIFGATDIDMQLRFFERGLGLFILPDLIFTEISIDNQPSCLWRKVGKQDVKTLFKFWVDENINVSKKRLFPVESFNNDMILLKSQGTKHKKWV